MILPPAVTVHGIDHARTAIAPGLPVLLLSAPGAATFAGAGWWRALIHAANTTQPDALDCADQPGRALEALHAGCQIIVLLPCPASPSIAARATHATILPTRPPALDLAQRGADRRLLAWLQRDTARPVG